MNDQMPRYNQAVLDWKTSVDEYEAALQDSAEAEAGHKAARAKAIIKIKAQNPRASNELAGATGDADPEVERLALLRLVKAAQVEGLKQRLFWHRALADNLRTQVVDERATNSFQSQAGAGPGRTTFQPQWSGSRGSGHPDSPGTERPAEPPRRAPEPEQRPAPPSTSAMPPRRPTAPPTESDDDGDWRY